LSYTTGLFCFRSHLLITIFIVVAPEGNYNN
jgi:hypothetical protein